jgi:prolyl oligopeptidase
MTGEDSLVWLEEVLGEEPLAWVKAQNERAIGKLGEPKESTMYDKILKILQSKEKIPHVRKVEEYYYNFWQDDEHVRGIWRRTSWEEYQKDKPDWETVLDVDALGKEDGKSWVYKGADIIDVDGEPRDRALVKLADGGSDAIVVREFDLVAKSFLKDGFTLPEAKTDICWRDRDTVLVGTKFGEGTLTDSGYPKQGKIWKRGQPLSDAELVYECEQTDIAASLSYDQEVGINYFWVIRAISFYDTEHFLRSEDGSLRKVNVPTFMKVEAFGDQLLFEPRKDWVGYDGKEYKAGSLIAVHWESALKSEAADMTLLFNPTDTKSLDGYCHTKDYLILTVLDDVKTTLVIWKKDGASWTPLDIPYLPTNLGVADASPLSARTRNDIFLTLQGFTSPATLNFTTVGDAGIVESSFKKLKALPQMFDATDVVVEQYFCVSADDTRIPYFQVGKPSSGTRKTLLFGYGGFEISLTPMYNAALGVGWLEKGNTFIYANIRGGGEYGPRWHQAALKEKRHKAYEDFIAVGEDLVKRGVCDSKTLGIQGGSNGGLLMGNMFVMRPDLWTAVVCQVPLLDMKRFHTLLAGASWMGEYGNPDTDDWEFLQKYSPYHHVQESAKYPQLFVTTSTKDDRVHPGHARKFVKRLLDLGHESTTMYWENIEGGHGGAADAPQQAYMRTLIYGFLEGTLSA